MPLVPPLPRRRPLRSGALAVIAALLIAGCGSAEPEPTRVASPSPSAPAASPAADYLSGRLDDLNGNLYVYRDAGDGANSYTQKAWMGASDNAEPMSESAAGIEGSSGIEAGIDFLNNSWGGYLFLAGSLAAGSSAPQPDFGKSAAGWDLTGAERLTFWARGEAGGERVEFFAGGLGDEQPVDHPDSLRQVSTGWVTLGTEWRRYDIDLAGRDLSQVAVGFGWVSRDAANPGATSVRFGIDAIRYEFAEPRGTPQLLASYAPAPPGTDAAIINGFAYVYDNAVAALALIEAGDLAGARLIGDALVVALASDRTYTDGRLRNAYANGDPRSAPAWLTDRGERFARLPGFWDEAAGAWFEDYYADSTASGNLAWAMLALVALHGATPGDTGYLDAARRIGDFVLTLQRPGSGFTGGYEGFDGEAVRVDYLSTEHNIDLVSAFRALAAALPDADGARYRAGADAARDFVLSMRDPDTGGLWTGTKADGVTPNTDVLPLDTNTWAVLALGAELPDPDKTMAFAQAHMAVGNGYDFNSDRDGIWTEGTAQAALAYEAIGEADKAAAILAGLNERALADGSAYAADRDGVTTGFVVAGTDVPWVYDRRVHVGASAWLAFAQLHYNPLEAP